MDKRPAGYAFLVAIGLLVGVVVGWYYRETSLGTVVGGGLGALAALALTLRDRARR